MLDDDDLPVAAASVAGPLTEGTVEITFDAPAAGDYLLLATCDGEPGDGTELRVLAAGASGGRPDGSAPPASPVSGRPAYTG